MDLQVDTYVHGLIGRYLWSWTYLQILMGMDIGRYSWAWTYREILIGMNLLVDTDVHGLIVRYLWAWSYRQILMGMDIGKFFDYPPCFFIFSLSTKIFKFFHFPPDFSRIFHFSFYTANNIFLKFSNFFPNFETFTKFFHFPPRFLNFFNFHQVFPEFSIFHFTRQTIFLKISKFFQF